MGEAAASTEGLMMHRRIDFHAATKPGAAPAVAGEFPMERLFADAGKRVAAARSEGEGRRFEEKGESSGSGFDPELSAARIYLRRIGAGLHNPGNTCYLNSVLQCLTYTEPLVAYLQSGNHKSSCRTAGFCALCAVQSHVRSALQSTGRILTPLQFIKNLRSISRSFRQYRQEDAHELMVNLLESMHKCCLPSGVPSESPSAYEKSLVHRIFGGCLRSQVKCARCLHCSNKFDVFLDLSLDIDNATTLVKALYNFTKEEPLDGGEKHYNCQHCKQKVVAMKRFTIDKAPSVLTIHLKRFSPFNPLQKIDKKVDFQTTLNLKPFVSDSKAMDLKYSLYGVLVHAGWNTQFGHYYCFVRTSSGIWHNLDDNKVRQVGEGDVLRQKAYMLFYVRDRERSPIMYNGAASLSSNKKMTPEKNTCMGGTIHNVLVDSAMQYSSLASESAKRKQNHTSNIHNTSQSQCSNAHNETEVTDASTSQNNVPASVQKTPFEDHCSNAYNKIEDTDASTYKNNEQASVQETHLGDLCHADNKTEVIDASTSQNNVPSSVQKTPFEDHCPNAYNKIELADASTPKNNVPASVQETHLGDLCHADNKTEVIDASTSQNNVPASVQKTPFEDQCPNAYNKIELADASTSKNNVPASVQETHLGDLCHAHNKSEVIDASTSHNNEPASVQKAPFTNPDGAATVSTVTNQTNSDSQRETVPPEQLDICKEPLQEVQLKSDGSLTDLGKDIADAAHPICNGADELSGANDQASEPDPDPFCKPIPDNNTDTIAQIIPTEDTAVLNQSVSKSTSGNVAKETGPVKQHNELVVVMEFSAKNVNDKENEEGQNQSLDSVHGSSEICCENSSQMVCSEDCPHVMCSEDSLLVLNKEPCHDGLHRDMTTKSKKHLKYPVVNLFFGSKQLLLGSLKMRKRKHKRIKRRLKSSMDAESVASDQQASTSDTVHAEVTSCKSRRQKRSRKTANFEEGVHFCNKKQNLGDTTSSVGLTIEKQESKNAKLSSVELARSGSSSIANGDSGKCAPRNEKVSSHFDLLTRGLRQIMVPQWDDNDLPDTTETVFQHSRSTSIGYVLDERDEEYDRGRKKKVKRLIKDFRGPNPFQETLDIRSWQRKGLRTDQPVRI